MSDGAAVPTAPQSLLAWVLAQLSLIADRSGNVFARDPPPGSLRGIDAYSGRDLPHAIANGCEKFRIAHGRLPKLLNPRGFNDKLVCAKYFMPVAPPDFADKCQVPRFIPEDLRGVIAGHNILWSSPRPVLPENSAIAPGRYWLKANHGWAMNRPVTYPLDPEERGRLEVQCAAWLAHRHGYGSGEWWYSRVSPRVFLCADVGDGSRPVTDYLIHVMNGTVRHIDVVTIGPTHVVLSASLYDADWTKLDTRRPGQPNPDMPRPARFEAIREAAARIGGRWDYMRVDFLAGNDGVPVLNEFTMCVGNATFSFDPPDYDLALGAAWDVSAWY